MAVVVACVVPGAKFVGGALVVFDPGNSFTIGESFVVTFAVTTGAAVCVGAAVVVSCVAATSGGGVMCVPSSWFVCDELALLPLCVLSPLIAARMPKMPPT